MSTIGDGPIDPRYEQKMQALARSLDEWFNGNDKGKDRKVGFALMVFDFGEGPGRANYISNASRENVVTLLKEQLARFEGQAEPKEGQT